MAITNALDYMNALRMVDDPKTVKHDLTTLSYAHNCAHYTRRVKNCAINALEEPFDNYRAIRTIALELKNSQCGAFIAAKLGLKNISYKQHLSSLLYCKSTLGSNEFHSGQFDSIIEQNDSVSSADLLERLERHFAILIKLQITSFIDYSRLIPPLHAEELKSYSRNHQMEIDSRSVLSADYINLLASIIGVALTRASEGSEVGQIHQEMCRLSNPKDELYAFVSTSLANANLRLMRDES
ncbi:hypothetical protein [Vibrio sp. 1180_3]|uniref:hypothetical protein n=1 Tax=Vibrio sp. 1180_3 TaxID=2528832 RepID=UPI002406DFA4|nr:hypothetical protein [Vibrio sp. 1180_3]MDF9399111.1 hypothetical protein [Vibrio sp. 1180_3]